MMAWSRMLPVGHDFFCCAGILGILLYYSSGYLGIGFTFISMGLEDLCCDRITAHTKNVLASIQFT